MYERLKTGRGVLESAVSNRCVVALGFLGLMAYGGLYATDVIPLCRSVDSSLRARINQAQSSGNFVGVVNMAERFLSAGGKDSCSADRKEMGLVSYENILKSLIYAVYDINDFTGQVMIASDYNIARKIAFSRSVKVSDMPDGWESAKEAVEAKKFVLATAIMENALREGSERSYPQIEHRVMVYTALYRLGDLLHGNKQPYYRGLGNSFLSAAHKLYGMVILPEGMPDLAGLELERLFGPDIRRWPKPAPVTFLNRNYYDETVLRKRLH